MKNKKEINTNGHKYIDLDLPSGTLWATMNVGANKPSDFGLYFQWGDTKGYTKSQVGKNKRFSSNLSDYKWNPSGDDSAFTKYKTTGATLALEDDAANKNMGGDWHMPTPEQIQELIDNTISTWTTKDGVNGKLFTSKNGNSIFIPAAGYASDGSLLDSGSYGEVWSSMLSAGGVDYGQGLGFGSSGVNLGGYGRCGGLRRAWRAWLGFIYPTAQTNFLIGCLQGAPHPKSILLEN